MRALTFWCQGRSLRTLALPTLHRLVELGKGQVLKTRLVTVPQDLFEDSIQAFILEGLVGPGVPQERGPQDAVRHHVRLWHLDGKQHSQLKKSFPQVRKGTNCCKRHHRTGA
eukprot:10893363-Alexandrium_andersonii.AAC.1